MDCIVDTEILNVDSFHQDPQNSAMNDVQEESSKETDEENPEIDILISNVMCVFSVSCHLNLRKIALNGLNVEYQKGTGLVRMRLRKPNTIATIYSSGTITCKGATSELEAKQSARRCARSLQKLGFNVRLGKFRVRNVLGSCTMPWAIKIESFSEHFRDVVQYEPEIQPGAIYKIPEGPTVRIFSTGSITVTAHSVDAVQKAIEYIYPLVHQFRRTRTPTERSTVEKRMRRLYQIDNTSDDVDCLS